MRHSTLLLASALWASAAGAAPVDRSAYPWAAPVTVPTGAEVVRIAVPPALRQAGEPDDASDLLLVDADGERVPAAVLRGSAPAERLRVRARPSSLPHVWELDTGGLPANRLTVGLPGHPHVARVTVEVPEGGGWRSLGPPTLVWNHPHLGRQEDVALRDGPLQGVTGVLRVRVDPLTPWAWRSADLDLWQDPGHAARPQELALTVLDQRIADGGSQRVTLGLPHSLPLASVTLDVDEELVDRTASLLVPARGWEGEEQVAGPASLQRVRLAGARLERMTLSGPRDPVAEDTLVVNISSEGQPPLTVTAATASLDGLELLVREPPPGPLTLLAGAPPGTTPPTDLQVALPALTARPWADATVGEPTENPRWTPPELAAGLAEPGRALDPAGFGWQAPVQGAGLVRVPLPLDVLTHSKADLSDLRLASADGQQLPFLLRKRPHTHDHASTPVTRTEDGPLSILEVPVPAPAVPVSTVTLRTPSPAFSRPVTLLRGGPGAWIPLRSADWTSTDRPGALTLDVDAVVGDVLRVEIDNGDDPPLAVGDLTLSWPAWELLTVLPEGGATLFFGDSARAAPDYDLWLLESELAPRATAIATVGPAEAREPPPRSRLDELLLLAGIGVLVGGLGLLTVRLVRSVGDGPLPDTEDSDDGTGEPDPDPARSDDAEE